MTFTVNHTGGGTDILKTFCIEESVYITPFATNYVAQVSNQVGLLTSGPDPAHRRNKRPFLKMSSPSAAADCGEIGLERACMPWLATRGGGFRLIGRSRMNP